MDLTYAKDVTFQQLEMKSTDHDDFFVAGAAVVSDRSVGPKPSSAAASHGGGGKGKGHGGKGSIKGGTKGGKGSQGKGAGQHVPAVVPPPSGVLSSGGPPVGVFPAGGYAGGNPMAFLGIGGSAPPGKNHPSEPSYTPVGHDIIDSANLQDLDDIWKNHSKEHTYGPAGGAFKFRVHKDFTETGKLDARHMLAPNSAANVGEQVDGEMKWRTSSGFIATHSNPSKLPPMNENSAPAHIEVRFVFGDQSQENQPCLRDGKSYAGKPGAALGSCGVFQGRDETVYLPLSFEGSVMLEL